MESKKDIRKRVLEKRNAITELEWKERSYTIYKKIAEHPFFLQADAVYSYVDYRKEVSTRDIIVHAWNCGKKVAVPKIVESTMEFFYIQNFSDLRKGYQGILEPTQAYPADDDNVLLIMPGTAFDQTCNRVGYGKGFYDVYLTKHSNFKTIALAFELQMVKNIPADEHDIRPNMIVTEENTYEPEFAQ